MTPTTTVTTDHRDSLYGSAGGSAVASGPTAVSWAAIFAGAGAACAISLILLILGTGLGLSSLSPWSNEGASGKALGIGTGLWVVFMQLAASILGGYIAGRLRTKWVSLHTEEVGFRDTAHGFLTWAVATLITAGLLTSTVSAIVGTGVQAGAQVAGSAAGGASAAAASSAASDSSKSDPSSYLMDSLFRSPKGSKSSASPEQSTAEVGRIFTNAATTGKLPEEDARYAAQVVSQRTGISQQDAEKRVNETFAQVQAKKQEAKEAADKARKASAAASLMLFISLLIGAFAASYAATIGGRHRDD
ncbi:MAG TPA: hypothetical protein VM140_03680 [Burkholderiales bacterium]|nr:hypothetical protein [Burkholderiales bacterium]